jgi:hypothetical protein
VSSTNRGSKRSEADFYPTPEWCVHALLNAWTPPKYGRWLEPCAGDGAIIKAVTSFYQDRYELLPAWEAVELRGECSDDLDRHALILSSQCPANFLQLDPAPGRYSVIITNPPYNLALEFIKHSLKFTDRVAMLLRLNFLASQSRREFHRRHPADVYVLSKRPSFTGSKTDSCEYAWFVWGDGGGKWRLL